MSNEIVNQPLTNQMATIPTQTALSGLVQRTRESFGNLLKERKPWSEVFDRTAFAKPQSVSEATSRLRKNVNYFKVNYILFVMATTAVCFLFSPTALLVLVFLAALWLFMMVLRPGPLTIGGRTFGDREKFLGLVCFSLFVAFFLTSVGSVLFYAIGIGLASVAVHGAFRVPDDLFLDEPEATAGLLSFLNIPTGVPGVTGPGLPTVATTV